MLTPRELEVLYYVCQGLNNKEIAQTLFISTHTVKAHVNAIKRKFNSKNRVESAFIAAKLNLI